MTTAIVGGGVAGLAAAHYLARRAPAAAQTRVVLLETAQRLGGWIDTTRHADGARFEHGPRTLRPSGAAGRNTLALAEDLGLRDSVVHVPRGHPAAENRLIYSAGRLHSLPSSLAGVLRRQPPFKRPLAWAAVKDLMTPAKICDDDSLFSFAARRFGADVARFTVDPLVRGVCAGDAREISAAAFVAGPAFALEQSHGGVIKGVVKTALRQWKRTRGGGAREPPPCELADRAAAERWSVWSFADGMATLPETLARSVAADGVEVRTGVDVMAIVASEDKNPVVETSSGAITADRVLLATPAHAAARLLGGSAPELARALAAVPYVTTAVVSLEFAGRDVLAGRDAFGFLVPSHETQVPILGVIFDTCSFPQGDRTVLTVMLGGRWFDSVLAAKPAGETAEEFFARLAADNVARILGVQAKPARVCTKILRDCIAQYTVGHGARVRAARALAKRCRIALVGAAYDGVGVNDAVMSARNAAMDDDDVR